MECGAKAGTSQGKTDLSDWIGSSSTPTTPTSSNAYADFDSCAYAYEAASREANEDAPSIEPASSAAPAADDGLPAEPLGDDGAEPAMDPAMGPPMEPGAAAPLAEASTDMHWREASRRNGQSDPEAVENACEIQCAFDANGDMDVLPGDQLLESIDKIPAKMAFKIGEAAQMIGVKQYVLRYWESEFDQLRPKRLSERIRRFTLAATSKLG